VKTASISGRGLPARVSRKSAVQRAWLAAMLIEKRIDIDSLSKKSIIEMCNSCAPYTNAMLKLDDHQRALVLRDKRPLVEPKQPKHCAHPRPGDPARAIFDALKARIDQLTDTSVVPDEMAVSDSLETEKVETKTA
jgi:hypothetical protein